MDYEVLRMKRLWVQALIVAAIIALIAALDGGLSLASAQTVDIRPAVSSVLEWIAGALLTVLTVLGSLALRFVSSKIGLANSQLEADLANRLNDIIHRGIDYAYLAALNEVNKPGSGLSSVKVDNYFVSLAVAYINRSAPDILNRFKVSPQRLEEMVMARLGSYMPQLPVQGALPATETVKQVNKELGVQTNRSTTGGVGSGQIVDPTTSAPNTGS
jgi:hypothetical protein